jgi:hypothetical protein
MFEASDLDQLWYTWTTYGLSGQSKGYGVRAASQGLYDIQGMRYRRVDRFLRYEPPKGVRAAEFTQSIAPITLAFINNGDENMLVRKVFVGQDAHGRNGVFFAHLIAGLPSSFTARDAIRLWYCPKLWIETEQALSPRETRLPQIPYQELLGYVRQSETSFNVASISNELANILTLILNEGLPSHLVVRGRSNFIAYLIYGITHCLPMTMLDGLTFTTYENEIDGFEARILGTTSAEDMQTIPTLAANPAGTSARISQDIQTYVRTAIDYLSKYDAKEFCTTRFYKLLGDAEKYGYASAEQLISLFKLRFSTEPLTPKSLEEMLRHPDDTIDKLREPATQQEAAELLLNSSDYWRSLGQGFFTSVMSWLDPNKRVPFSQEGRAALAVFINGVAEVIVSAMAQEILQERIPEYCEVLLKVLAGPSINPHLWTNKIIQLPQDIYIKATGEKLWPFREWLLKGAMLVQPQPKADQMQSWLGVSRWDKLGKLLKLDLPPQWERVSIIGLIEHVEREIPVYGIPVIQAHVAKFQDALRQLLQESYRQNNPDWTAAVVRFFIGLVAREYQDRAAQNDQAELDRMLVLQFLIVLLNVSPKDQAVIEKLFFTVRLGTPAQLIASEIDTVLANCSEEVIVACATSPSLSEYIIEFIRGLTPGKLANASAQNLLNLLTAQSSLPNDIRLFIADWFVITSFQQSPEIERETLENLKTVLQRLLPVKQYQLGINQSSGIPPAVQKTNSRRQKFVAEMIPLLVTHTKTESDLTNVLDVMGLFLLDSRWELLRWMAPIARQEFARDMSRLTPYLFCGVREYNQIRTRYVPDVLDTYLQALYSGVDEKTLRKIEGWVAEGLSPDYELVRYEWNGWRQRAKNPKHFLQAYGGGVIKGNTYPTPSYPATAQPRANPEWQGNQQGNLPTAYPASQHIQPGYSPILPGNGQGVGSGGPPGQGVLGEQRNQAAMQKQQSQYVLAVTTKNHQFSRPWEYYRQIHNAMLQALRYWKPVYSKKLTQGQKTSESVKYEVHTLEKLQEELSNSGKGNTYSEQLLLYWMDDELIQGEVQQWVDRDKANPSLFDPESQLQAHFDELIKLLGSEYAQPDDIKYVLRILIRRDLFIRYLEAPQGLLNGLGNKNKMQAWVKNKHKDAKIIAN